MLTSLQTPLVEMSQCFELNGLKKQLTFQNSKLAIELLIICYLAGAQLVPGGHQQFQMWYWDLLPLAMEMTGLPSFLTFKLYRDIYPAHLPHPMVHHHFSMLLSLWLLVLGPDFI